MMTTTNDRKYFCKLVEVPLCPHDEEVMVKEAILTDQEMNRKNTDLMFDYLELPEREQKTGSRLAWYRVYEVIDRKGEINVPKN